MRTGLLAKKVGMSRVFSDKGENIPVTLLKLDNCQVVSVKTEEKDGYNAVQIGAGTKKAKNISKPLRNHFAKSKVEPNEKIVEFRVSEDALPEVGLKLSAYHFIAGQKVDVGGITHGKGFQGVMKRHNFGGLEATHGISVSHRSHGSTGQCQDPGRVFKGKKMAGQMGNVKATKQNLLVISTDEEEGIIVVKGSVPGSKGSYVTISDAVKVGTPEEAPFPAARFGSKKAAAAAAAAEEEAAKKAEEEALAKAEEQKAQEAAAKAASDSAGEGEEKKEDSKPEGEANAAPEAKDEENKDES